MERSIGFSSHCTVLTFFEVEQKFSKQSILLA